MPGTEHSSLFFFRRQFQKKCFMTAPPVVLQLQVDGVGQEGAVKGSGFDEHPLPAKL
jgi:hypothetical protein